MVVPTRNRPAKLSRCLAALAVARAGQDLSVLVCDSSDDRGAKEVLDVCAQYPFVTVRRHSGKNVAAARNVCIQLATADVLISVDDDVRVDPDAISELIKCYLASPSPSVIAGSVAWNGVYHRPVVMRRIGYGRPAGDGEPPSFLVTALFAFPRELGLALPWNERIRTSDDVFMGALWRRHGVPMGYAPSARATHDREHHHYGVEDQSSHIYVNLFDTLIANPDLKRAFQYEFLGFAAGAKLYFRRPSSGVRYVAAWTRGNWNLIRDWSYLKKMARRELPQMLGTNPGPGGPVRPPGPATGQAAG